MPSAADLRKVGLGPSKPGTPSIPARKELQPEVDGEKNDDIQTPLTPEEQAPEAVPQKPTIEEDLAAFAILPVPNPGDADIDTLKDAVQSAIRLASDADNRPVIKGLLRMWEKCGNDPYALDILDGVCQETPDSPQRSMFQKVMQGAWSELETQDVAGNEIATLPAPRRARSGSSESTLSSAKSLDAETYAPAVASTASAGQAKKGRQAKNTKQKKNVPERRSVLASGARQRQTASENPELSTEAVQAKRTRLRKSIPKIVAPESGLRSSLAKNPRSNLSSPGPVAKDIDDSTDDAATRSQRSESVSSSDAGDNRRLTPSLRYVLTAFVAFRLQPFYLLPTGHWNG
jgi:hypothetical protein